MKTWQATQEFWIDGNLVKTDDLIALSASQSKYLGHAIKEPDASTPAAPEAPAEAPEEPSEPAQSKSRRQRLKDAVHGDID